MLTDEELEMLRLAAVENIIRERDEARAEAQQLRAALLAIHHLATTTPTPAQTRQDDRDTDSGSIGPERR